MGKTFDGSAYAFVELNCPSSGLTNLYGVMNAYPHLRKITFANNKIVDASSLSWIPYLTHLNLSANHLQNLSCFNLEGSLQFLVHLNLSGNKITVTPIHPSIATRKYTGPTTKAIEPIIQLNRFLCWLQWTSFFRNTRTQK